MNALPARPAVTARPGAAARTAATALLSGVLDDHRSLDALIAEHGPYRALPVRDRALTRAIVGTALRHHGELTALLDRLIERRPERAGDLMRVIEIAAAQVLFMDVADHAAVSIAIDRISADRAARRYKSLANAVLRRLARDGAALLAGLDAAALDTPSWLWRRWCQNYGETTARRIAEAHRHEPSLDLTVKSDPAAWADRLGGIVLPTGTVRTDAGGAVETLAGYADGAWWVQDAAAALPTRLLGDIAGKRVADLCAAPGGKSAALVGAGARVTAVDVSAARLERLAANLARLGFSADVIAADVLDWQPSETFDAVLLDAPCTATGTIRRHPDIAVAEASRRHSGACRASGPHDRARRRVHQAGRHHRLLHVLARAGRGRGPSRADPRPPAGAPGAGHIGRNRRNRRSGDAAGDRADAAVPPAGQGAAPLRP